MNGLKIISLTAENVKRIEAVEIHPSGNLVELTGKNGAGKTSVLDSILYAIAGGRGIPSQPIRKGQQHASIKLDLGKFIVRRKFASKEDGYSTTVTVESAEGAQFRSPQAMLDSFFDTLTFDPLAFSRMDPKQQFDSLRRFVPDVDFDQIDGLNRRDFDQRTQINRQAKEARAAANQIQVPDDTPAEPIDDVELVAELERAGQYNAEIEERKAERRSRQEHAGRLKDSAIACREKAAKLREQADAEDQKASNYLQQATDIEKSIESIPIPSPVDTSAVRAKIAQAKSINQAVTRRQQKQQQIDKAHKLEAEAQRLTQQIEARLTDKQSKIAAAKLPVDGLGFGDGCVTLNGVPFEQASDAEQLRASIAIAMAGNPTLRVIRVRDGSLLDEEGMRILSEMADAHNCQVWIERVSSDGKVGIVIEDGRVVAVDGKVRCDGDHPLPACDDKNCWHRHDKGDPIAATPVEEIEPVGAAS